VSTSSPQPPDYPYQLHTGPSARRAIAEQLPTGVAFAVAEFITGPLLDNPHRVGKRLIRPPLQGSYSARRGAYRIIYDIDERTRTVTITAIDYRADIYHSR